MVSFQKARLAVQKFSDWNNEEKKEFRRNMASVNAAQDQMWAALTMTVRGMCGIAPEQVQQLVRDLCQEMDLDAALETCNYKNALPPEDCKKFIAKMAGLALVECIAKFSQNNEESM